MDEDRDYITLKWGTLKSWKITSAEGLALLQEYVSIGSSMSAMAQQDTPRRKEIIYRLIDLVPGEVYLDWDDEYVSHEKAKLYVMNYGVQQRHAVDFPSAPLRANR